MFDNLLMSMNSKLKKIMSGLETNEGKIDEISTDVGSVGTSVATVQSTSDEIKALIGTEIATQLSALQANIIAAMPSGSSGLTSCIRNIQRGSVSCAKGADVSVTLSGFTDASKMSVKVWGSNMQSMSNHDDGMTHYAAIAPSALTATKLTIKTILHENHSIISNTSMDTVTYYYEVIEFY